MSNVIEVKTDTFKSEVVDSDKPVLVDFWAEWCGPCRKLSPLVEELADEHSDRFVFAKVNVDEERQLAAMFQIMSIPALMIFKNGKKVDELIGFKPKNQILRALESHV
ncbi:thioredoxin [Corynebacterium ulceribovis]|uniref:thioredoxin n=1 Tax=Corynebacterium ulceribovis TaxID=487732 RepID=UPI000376F5E8|nr:thioredoxin [Corynebacterium ulceribovis]